MGDQDERDLDTTVPVWTAYDIAELGYDRQTRVYGRDSDSRERFVCASTGV